MSYYIPELDYYFRSYWKSRGEINTETVKVPEIEEEYSFTDASFLELLFSQTFSHNYYNYRFETKALTYFSKPVRERIYANYNSVICYVTTDSTTGENIFSLTNDDITMLDKLLEYRYSTSTSLTGIAYTSLDTNLSKLIYIYLDLMINSNYSRLNSSSLISSSSNLLDNLFEVYVINEAHKAMKSWSTIIDANLLELRLVHDVILITEEMETLEEIVLTKPSYDSNINIWVNGEKLDSDEFDILFVYDSTGGDSTSYSTYITWEDKDADIIENDTLVAEYYTKVVTTDDGTPYVDGNLYTGSAGG